MSTLKIEAKKQERSRPKYIYPSGGGRPYMSTTYREFNSKPRVYVHPDNENVLQNFANRMDRPIELYRQAAKQALAELGIEGKLNWSQKAGCSCGCSPGFVLTVENEFGQVPYDLFVTINDIEPQPLTERGANRLGQLLSDPTVTGALRATSRQRNYRAMKDDKLRRVAGELRYGGDARERSATPEADLQLVEQLLSEREL